MSDNDLCVPGTCSKLGRISKLEAHYDNVAGALIKLESKIDLVLTHLGKIEVLEQKHLSSDQAHSRAFGEIKGIKDDVSNLYRGMEAGIKETVHVLSKDLKESEARLSASIAAVDKKAEQNEKNFQAMMNRMRGAAWVIGVMWAVFGAAIVYLLIERIS